MPSLPHFPGTLNLTETDHASTEVLPILSFEPIVKRARWGGRRLGERLGKRIGSETDYAESWELADLGPQQTSVLDGPYADWTLERLTQFRGDLLLGPDWSGSRFPLLVKFLDAADRLSVQVHPDDAAAARVNPQWCGKTEAWVILEAEPGSRLYVGLNDGVTREDLQRHLAEGTVADCLHEFETVPGDCVLVPAGTVHAIGEGILLAEIQQPSDITYRLFDWNRLDSDSRPRPLQIDEALRSLRFDGPVNPTRPRQLAAIRHRAEHLVSSPYFDMVRRKGPGIWVPDDDGQCHVVLVLNGRADLRYGSETESLAIGATRLLPARRAASEWTLSEGTILLDVTPVLR
jgi:mannose-6-phosphate isomerase